MIANIIIRKATSFDLDFLMKIQQEAFISGRNIFEWEDFVSYPGMPTDLSDFPRDKEYGYIAETNDGKPIGAAWIRVNAHNEIYSKFIYPELTIGILDEYRNKGIGSMLMNEIIRSAGHSDIKQIYLSVHKDNNQARLFYEKHDWKYKENTLDHYLMVLKI